MNYKIMLGFCLILFLSTVFAAAPTLTGLTITPYVTTDKNYIEFPITMYTTASGDINSNSQCWYKVSSSTSVFAADWNSDTNRCTLTGYSSAGVDDFNFSMIVSSNARDANATTPTVFAWRDSNAPVSSAVFDNDITVTITPTDYATNTGNGSGIKNIWYRINGGTWTDAGAVTSYGVVVTENGSNTIDYYSIDALDNNEASQDQNYWTITFTVNADEFVVRDFQEGMCINATGIPNSLWLVVIVMLILLIIIIVTALKNPMELSSSFLLDNVMILVPVAIIIMLLIFISIVFVLMGGVICATVV